MSTASDSEPTASTPLVALLLPDLRQLVLSGDRNKIRAVVAELHPADLAELLLFLEPGEREALLKALDSRRRVDTFEHLDEEQQRQIVAHLEPDVLPALLNDMSSDDRADLFKRLPAEMRERLLGVMAQAERNDVKRLLEYPEDTAGAIMSTEYATVSPDMSVAVALEHLRRQAPRSETIYSVYVVDQNRRLAGVVSLVDLITAPASERMDHIMRPNVIALRADVDREEVARAVAKYDFLAIPIVDDQEKLVGIVTHDDVIDVLQAEQTEDVHLAAAIGPTDTPYTRASIGLLFRKRIVWLLVLLLAGFLSSTVVSAFEKSLATVVTLAFFIPVLIGSGGNTGSQSATLVIRALATGDLQIGEWVRMEFKELLVGLALGVAMAGAVYMWGFFWPAARVVAPVVGLSMVVVVLWANLVGALTPLVLRRVGIDPAVASAPLITTLIDATGLLIYFSIAGWMLDLH